MTLESKFFILASIIALSLIGIIGVQESFAQYLPTHENIRDQTHRGSLPWQLSCGHFYDALIFKSLNSPACVSSETAEKLIERGWTSGKILPKKELLFSVYLPPGNPNFGSSFGMINDDILVGSPVADHHLYRDTEFFSGDASVYLYNSTNGKIVLEIKNPTENPSFGHSVTSSLDKIIVGSPGWDKFNGSVHVFDSKTGKLIMSLDVPRHSEYEKQFGQKVDANDEIIFVGSPIHRTFVDKFVYAFNATDGQLLYKIKNPGYRIDPSSFGYFFDIFNDKIFVSDTAGIYQGVFVYDVYSGKSLLNFTTPIPEKVPESVLISGELEGYPMTEGQYHGIYPSQLFGYSISIDENFLLIGSPNDGADTYIGAAYLYELNSSDLKYLIKNPEENVKTSAGLTKTHFGDFVQLLDNHIIVGNSDDNLIYAYDIFTGKLISKLISFEDTQSKSTELFSFKNRLIVKNIVDMEYVNFHVFLIK